MSWSQVHDDDNNDDDDDDNHDDDDNGEEEEETTRMSRYELDPGPGPGADKLTPFIRLLHVRHSIIDDWDDHDENDESLIKSLQL